MDGMVTEWSRILDESWTNRGRDGHGMATGWSRDGHGMVTGWSRYGHGHVTKTKGLNKKN